MRIFKEFRFESAHRLPHVPEGHKCGRLHGHSYRVEVHVAGPVGDDGMVTDFGNITGVFEPLRLILDHNYLNDIPGLENPTSENLCKWIWNKLCGELPGLCGVVSRETCTSGCSYTGGA